MLNQIRNISARITLLVYLSSFLTVALFHYHGLKNTVPQADEVGYHQHNSQERTGDTDEDHCSLCLISHAQADVFSGFVLTNDNNREINFQPEYSGYSSFFSSWYPKRAPPSVTA